MHEVSRFLVEYGYVVLFVWVFLDQVGFPFPAAPYMLAAGAMAGLGQLDLAVTLGVAVVAALPADFLWYEIGRRRGAAVLRFLCRISLEPDSCVRDTEKTFARHGPRSLLIAKFIPGLETVAPPLAGVVHMRFSRFLLFDIAGTVWWSITFLGLGYVLHDELQRVSQLAVQLGGWLVAILGGALGIYLLAKYARRRRFLRSLRIARIAPEELKRMLDADEEIEIVDLRHSLEFEAEPYSLPGAVRIPVEEIDARHHAIPRDRDIVLYCT